MQNRGVIFYEPVFRPWVYRKVSLTGGRHYNETKKIVTMQENTAKLRRRINKSGGASPPWTLTYEYSECWYKFVAIMYNRCMCEKHTPVVFYWL